MNFRPLVLVKGLAVLGVVALLVVGYRAGLVFYLDRLCAASGGLQAGQPPVASSVYVRADVDRYFHFGHVISALADSRFTVVETNEPLANLVYPNIDPALFPAGSVAYYRHFLASADSRHCLQPSLVVRQETLAHRLLASGVPSRICLAGEQVDVLTSEHAVLRRDTSELVGLTHVDWTSLSSVHLATGRVEARWAGFRSCLFGTDAGEGAERCWGGRANEYRCPLGAGPGSSVIAYLPDIIQSTPHPLLADLRVEDDDRIQSVRSRSTAATLVDERVYSPPRALAPSERADFRNPESRRRDIALSVDRVIVFDEALVRRVRIRTEEIRGAVLSNLRLTEDGMVFIARNSVRPPGPSGSSAPPPRSRWSSHGE